MKQADPVKNLRIRQAETEDNTFWDDYVRCHQNGLAYHFFAWKLAVQDAYGFDCPYLYAQQGEKICGVLPLVHIRPPLGKGELVSLPYCDVGGMLSDNAETARALFDQACAYARAKKIPSLEIRSAGGILSPETFSGNPGMPVFDSRFSAAGSALDGKVRMVLELPGSADVLLGSLKSKVRSQVRKPAKDGLFARLGGKELIDDFYPVFARNMTDLGSPVHSKKWLAAVLQRYGNRARCGVVYMPDKTPAAGGIIVLCGSVVSIPWASSLRRFNRYNPNMFLYWSFLQYAADNGFTLFDFGRSTVGEGTYHFKAQWGARPGPLYRAKWEISEKGVSPADPETGLTVPGRKRDLAERVIRSIPLPAAVFMGSRIRKYISL